MHDLLGIFQNRALLCAVTGWFVAQAIKIPTYWFVEKTWDWKRFFGSGGMPSSHTAFVVSLGIMVGALVGYDSVEFAVCFILAAVVMYDATGVRRETGIQAQVINEILRQVFIDGKPIADDDLKELVGHKPLEVLGGAIIGLITAGIYLLF
ncbi:MAG: divergent PAP2 family protein [Clostridia bacterium]|nr:divergent PAP2 family protein [Clostridia bacterium]